MTQHASADPVAGLVRSTEFGRYAASLFAPAEIRPHLLALYAFDIELARVRDFVSEPLPGELRLQWWRDALEDPERADAVSHPVARALEAAIDFGRLPRQALVELVDARIDDLYDDPVETVAALEGRLGATHSAVLRLASLIAAHGQDPGGADAAGFAGVAEGVARLLRLLPRHAARGQVLLPLDLMAAHGVNRDDLVAGRPTPGLDAAIRDLVALGRLRLSEARAAYSGASALAAPAFLPIALVPPALKRFGGVGAGLAPQPEPARWLSLIRLWRVSRKRPPF